MILNGLDGLKIGPLENTYVTGPIDAILGFHNPLTMEHQMNLSNSQFHMLTLSKINYLSMKESLNQEIFKIDTELDNFQRMHVEPHSLIKRNAQVLVFQRHCSFVSLLMFELLFPTFIEVVFLKIRIFYYLEIR